MKPPRPHCPTLVSSSQAESEDTIASMTGLPHRGEWKIYDVVVEDISVVANYRSQFNRILAKGSFDDLIQRLKEKETKIRD